MLHTKLQGHWPFSSGEDFSRVFTIWAWPPPWSCDPDPANKTNFRSPDPWRLHMKFGFDWPSGFGEENLRKWWTDGRPTDHGYTISSPMSLKAQVSLKDTG